METKLWTIANRNYICFIRGWFSLICTIDVVIMIFNLDGKCSQVNFYLQSYILILVRFRLFDLDNIVYTSKFSRRCRPNF